MKIYGDKNSGNCLKVRWVCDHLALPYHWERGCAALDHLERHLGRNRFTVGPAFSLADVALVAYTRVAHEGGFDLASYASIRRWIGETERNLGLPQAG